MSCRFALAATLFAASACGFSSACSAAQLGDVEHIIVIYLENHSFDNLFGFFPGADGIATAGATKIQVDRNGKPYDFLPPAMEAVDLPHNKEVDKQLPADLLSAIKKFDKRMSVDRRFPDNLPNQPFSIDAYVPLGDKTGDPIHRFYPQQAQIDGGLMDKFVAYTNVGALVMGYYDGSSHKPLEICGALHTSRSFLPSCLRRLLPQSFLVNLRVHAPLRQRARQAQGGLRCQRPSSWATRPGHP